MKLEFTNDEVRGILLDGNLPLYVREMFLSKLDIIERFDKNGVL